MKLLIYPIYDSLFDSYQINQLINYESIQNYVFQFSERLDEAHSC